MTEHITEENIRQALGILTEGRDDDLLSELNMALIDVEINASDRSLRFFLNRIMNKKTVNAIASALAQGDKTAEIVTLKLVRLLVAPSDEVFLDIVLRDDNDPSRYRDIASWVNLSRTENVYKRNFYSNLFALVLARKNGGGLRSALVRRLASVISEYAGIVDGVHPEDSPSEIRFADGSVLPCNMECALPFPYSMNMPYPVITSAFFSGGFPEKGVFSRENMKTLITRVISAHFLEEGLNRRITLPILMNLKGLIQSTLDMGDFRRYIRCGNKELLRFLRSLYLETSHDTKTNIRDFSTDQDQSARIIIPQSEFRTGDPYYAQIKNMFGINAENLAEAEHYLFTG